MAQINRLFIDEKRCQHSDVFFCTSVSVPEGITYAMACSFLCGFWLNFDPVWAGAIQEVHVPKDYRHDFWRLNTVAFLPNPDPNRIWKDSQPMAHEGTKMGRNGL